MFVLHYGLSKRSKKKFTCCDIVDVEVVSLRGDIGGVHHQTQGLTGVTELLLGVLENKGGYLYSNIITNYNNYNIKVNPRYQVNK